MFPGRKHPREHKFSNELVNLTQFRQDNGLTRNTWARSKNEKCPQIFTGSPGIFTIPSTLKLHFNPCAAHPSHHTHVLCRNENVETSSIPFQPTVVPPLKFPIVNTIANL